MAEELATSSDWLLGNLPEADVAPLTARSEAVLAEGIRPFRAGGPFQDLPVYGTALGHSLHFDGNGALEVEQTILEPTETIRHVQRPPALVGVKTAYCLYIQGDSMAPRHEPGDLVVVDPRKAPSPGDDVIVQLRGENGGEGAEVVCALIKRLVRRSASYVELEQFNPAHRFRIETEKVAAIHRLVRMVDLLGG